MINNALIVDDREDFTKELKSEAKEYEINVASRTNLKEMIEFLDKYADKLTMIILDIKCLIEPMQEVEHESFLPAALMYLEKEYKYIPRVILTADSVSYEEVSRYHPDEKIFRKTTEDILKLFDYIKQKGEELPILKIRYEFSDMFKVFDKNYLCKDEEKELLELLKNMNSKDMTQIKNNLVIIRRIQEKILQTINKNNKQIVPDRCMGNNGTVKFREVDKHLKGNKSHQSNYIAISTDYYSGVIEEISPMIYNIASSTAAHNTYENVDFPPSNYTVKCCTFALLDFIRWFDKRIDESQK
ncbi:hypothetical protein [Clostridium saccharoperbutylacetonicum]|uniref:hypothetical protein n=1 Tax=Clostridium saccharoperbutylacetonicum TaxID=36745 RepID=UPI000983BE26|nr:hypothetical protein [Clostridium saccharoperbutylacetonicum]AQR96490.1 hypothetical protein CLSAP_38140 [Clostridium saccharoperbutylacetonicum]NSB32364.1 hypothetical protein [Clostridium saccharoperbutylacetonicum]